MLTSALAKIGVVVDFRRDHNKILSLSYGWLSGCVGSFPWELIAPRTRRNTIRLVTASLRRQRQRAGPCGERCGPTTTWHEYAFTSVSDRER